MSKFYLPSSTPASTTSPSPLQSPNYESNYQPSLATYSDSEDEDTLPYPAPLPRSAFLAPNFSAQEYLSSLRNRHQTLEDLRSDLRSRVQELSKELFDLINNEYEDFLSVGSTLRGGEDKIEQVRVGVLGFRREIENMRDAIRGRGEEVAGLLEERKIARRNIALGRKLLNVEERLGELEARLIVDPADQSQASDDEEEDDEEEESLHEQGSQLVSKLRGHALLYLQVKQSMEQIGQHPFIKSLEARVIKVRNTLLLDLGTAMRQMKTAGAAGNGSLLKIVGIYRQLGEGGEAIRALKAG